MELNKLNVKIGEKIYSRYHKHGLEIVDVLEFGNNGHFFYECVPIYFDGVRIEECDTATHDIEYLKKNYVPLSKIRNRKLKQIKENLDDVSEE